jgi:putative ABC transport system substrate-binding protein
MNQVGRRQFMIASGALLVAALAEAQPARTNYRIGFLAPTSRAFMASAGYLQSFEQGLRELGYVEGRNLDIEWREAEGRVERLTALAAELVALKVDVIVTTANVSAVAAKYATDAIPIVFVAAVDPVGQGLVKSLARPGGNVTGFTADLSETLVGKRLELLREAVPHLRRLAVMHYPGDANSVLTLAAAREAGAVMKLQLRVHEVEATGGFESVFREIEQEHPEGLLVLSSGLTLVHRKRIAEFAAAQRLPAVYGFVEFVVAGGLMSYGFSFRDNFRRAAVYVDKILKGTKPADLPVQQPTTFELVINMNTAKATGIKIPQSILVRADRVIE